MDIMTIDEPWAPSQILRADKPILIVEGMSAAFVKVELFDLSIACFTDSATELSRRLERDVSERGHEADFVIKTHKERRQQYEYYLESLLAEVDIVVNQAHNDFYWESCHRLM